MNQTIFKLCKRIEKKHNVTILFAVESGSRAWGLDSKDSDYDVRFVYYSRYKDYLKLNKPTDVIKCSFDKNGKPCADKGCMIDMVGFDLFKFASMLSNSNPQVVEWLQSDIVYYGEQPKEFIKYLDHVSTRSMFYHYLNMGKSNYLKYLKTSSKVTYKKYLYAMRGIVNAGYIQEYCMVPDIVFEVTMRSSKLPLLVVKKLDRIIALKRTGTEQREYMREGILDAYIERMLKKYDKDLPKAEHDKKVYILDNEILRILGVE